MSGDDDIAGAPEPRANPDLLGHDGVERTLLDAYRSGRLPHGWLIAGPRGIGKATLAFRFARFVLAGGGEAGLFGDGPDSLHVDADDPVFRRIAAASHADLMTLERTAGDDGRLRSSIVVADVRKAGAFLSLTAAEGGWRVVVVDSADELNDNASNALLKMLEEPPSNTLIMLVSHSPGRLSATIRSRCCRVSMKALSAETVGRLLRRYRPDLAEADADALARLADGSIGRALGLAEIGGLDLYRELLGLLDALPRLDRAAIHGLGDRLARNSADAAYRTVTGLLVWWLARMVRAGARAEFDACEVVGGEADCMRRLLGRGGLAQWAGVWEKVSRSIAEADRVHLDRKQVVLGAFHSMEQVARA